MTTFIFCVFAVLVGCHVGVAADEAMLKRQWGCRNFADLAVRCGKVAPSTELPPEDVKFLGVLETCCVIKSENAHVLRNPLMKLDQYVPSFCNDTSSIQEDKAAVIDHLVFLLSHATDKDGGRASWQHTWRAQNILLQQACDPVAMHMVMQNAVDLLNKQEAIIDFVELLWQPFKQTNEWQRPADKRNAIRMLQEVLMRIPSVNLLFGSAHTASLVLLAVLGGTAVLRVYLESRPSTSEIGVAGVVLVIRLAMEDWLPFLLAVLAVCIFVGLRVAFSRRRTRSNNPSVTVVTADSPSALELIQTIFYGSLLDSSVRSFCMDFVEFVLSARAAQRGSLPWFWNEAVRVSTKREAPNRANDIFHQHERDAQTIADRVKARHS